MGDAAPYEADPSALSFGRTYFDGMYTASTDPWNFESSRYERRKYDMTIASLPERRYERGVEPGCSIGVLTERLADRCDQLHAFDFNAAAVEQCRQRLAGVDHVTVEEGSFPAYWPSAGGMDGFDLVVWSEVAYYLTASGMAVAADGLRRHLRPEGDLVAVHYLGETNYPMPGGDVIPWLDSLPILRRTTATVDEQFALGVYRRTEG